MTEPAPIAPAHATAYGGYDLNTPCSCARVPMADGRPCPCRCHVMQRHQRLHITPAEWCPACQAIAAQTPAPAPCAHDRAGAAGPYLYCPDCGATRYADRPGTRPDPWHTCAACQLPQEPTQ